jgi:steroid delta-isomerase-like uncharacterized protein
MDEDEFDRFTEAWVLHRRAGSPRGSAELRTLRTFYSEDVRYDDVPTAASFVGHDGIRQMCELAHRWASDLEFIVLTQLVDGAMFAMETESRGTNDSPLGGLPATGRTFMLKGVSMGRFDAHGLICEQRDYWDLGSFLGQIGVLPPME